MAISLSLVLAVWTATTASAQPFVGGLSLPFADISTLGLSVGGYVLTPVVVFGALVWDRLAQRLGLRDRNFGLKPQYTVTLQWLAGAGMLLAAWHVLNIAYGLSGA
ncbi:hypothetical protein [Homoserinibacter gongjuensis]|uniref:hypothetical protein n=1 Tax=Homoserinibacter gongjuensis TaxID=1162968 RepID=UPI0024E06E7B|nr:hypothetical protein [Homoserinibacter gongjuensis]